MPSSEPTPSPLPGGEPATGPSSEGTRSAEVQGGSKRSMREGASCSSLPNLIEIVPLTSAVEAEISIPGSKSITNRALVLAALGNGLSTLRGALWSEDTQVMVDCLRKLGFEVEVRPESREPCNRTILVHGRAGAIPPGGTAAKPLDLFVGNAGTAARFLAALVCLGSGVYRLSGVPRMGERPQADLFKALRSLGYRVDSSNDKLPVLIHGGGRRAGACRVSIEESSQFASALLLCASAAQWSVEVIGENAEESPYVAMTRQLLETFPRPAGEFQIEPDASSASYFWGAAWLLGQKPGLKISIPAWPGSGWQIDARFPGFLPLPEVVSRRDDLGDSIMTAIVLAPFADRPVKFTHLSRLRVQECDRVLALHDELRRCGAKINMSPDGETLEVFPSRLHGADINTYDDHRVAMSFAILGLKVPELRLKNAACVKKTFPNFFGKLAAAPPRGLGAAIRHGETGELLAPEQLIAD